VTALLIAAASSIITFLACLGFIILAGWWIIRKLVG